MQWYPRRLLTNRKIILLLMIAAALVAGCAYLKRQSKSLACGNTMIAITFASRLWPDDHAEHYPSDLRSMRGLFHPALLICPSDESRKPASDWDSFTTENSSYEIVTPDLQSADIQRAFLRCKIHGHLSYADCTVFDGVRRRTKYP